MCRVFASRWFIPSFNLSALHTVCIYVQGVCVWVCGRTCVCMSVCACFVVLQSVFTCWPGWVKWMIVWSDWEEGELVFLDTLLVQLVVLFFFSSDGVYFSQHCMFTLMDTYTHTTVCILVFPSHTYTHTHIWTLKACERVIIHWLLCDWSGTLFNGGTVGNYQPSMRLLHFFTGLKVNKVQICWMNWIFFFFLSYSERVCNCF